jgi:5'-nucleotidase
MKKTILLTNDDGCLSVGITALKERLSLTYDVYVVAPDRERSAISMALTLHHPLRINRKEKRMYAIDGTPADCVNIAIQKILPEKPDFIISGMNLGENLSEDIFFSGTVGGAFAGLLYGIPSMAVSLIADHDEEGNPVFNPGSGAEITDKILSKLLKVKPDPVVYNVNIPYRHNGNVMPTSLGSKRYKPQIVEKRDPRGKRYYWIGTGDPDYRSKRGTDIWAVKHDRVSITAVHYDLNSVKYKKKLTGLFDEI